MAYGIIGAMREEVDLLIVKLEGAHTETIATMDFVTGRLNGVDVVVVEGRGGKVNAAMCTQVLIDRFDVSHIIFTGVAGSLDFSIEIGDLIISTDLIQHDADLTGFGYPPGVLPDLHLLSFAADDELRARAMRAAAEVCPEVAAYEGRIATGDQFVQSLERKEFIVKTFGASCVEMEGAAVAQVAWLNDVPFVVVRAISDKADGSAHADFAEFLPESARRAAALVEYLVCNE